MVELMNNRKYYLILFLVLSLTIVLFGLSYAKSAGVVSEPNIINYYADGMKIIYSKDNVLNLEEIQEIDLSIINTNNYDIEYEVRVLEVNNREFDDVYYQINDSVSMKLDDGTLYIGKLSKLKENNDYEKINIKIWSLSKTDYKFNINVKKINTSSLDYIVKKDNSVYKDNNDYRYYGSIVNNYIKYEDKMYRIIGFLDKKYKLISLDSNYESYKESDKTYLTIDDYLKSINESNVSIEDLSSYNSWLNAANGYWLDDVVDEYNSYYVDSNGVITSKLKTEKLYSKEVIVLDKGLVVLKGNGTLEEPYEVSYGE